MKIIPLDTICRYITTIKEMALNTVRINKPNFPFQFHPLYFLSYILVVTGVIVFVIKPTPIASTSRGYYRLVYKEFLFVDFIA